MSRLPQPVPVEPDPRRPARAVCARSDLPGVELHVAIRPDRPVPVVTVTGALNAGGESLLTAMLDYVAGDAGRHMAVDLRGVSRADTSGLLPPLRAGVVVVAASPVARRLLAALGPRRLGGVPPACSGHLSSRARSAG